jgi:hypothetical protein
MHFLTGDGKGKSRVEEMVKYIRTAAGVCAIKKADRKSNLILLSLCRVM